MSEPERDPRVGTVVLGDMVVVRRLGAGGFATLYEVRLRASDERAALKVLHPAYAQDPEVTARLFREAMAVGRAESPRVVGAFGAGLLEDGAPYVLLELVEGRSLRARLDAERTMPAGEAVRVAREIAEGLAAAHAVGVVHRDIKPDNVLLVRDADGREHAKIVDFGLSKLLPGQSDRFGALTQSGAVLGTPQYLAPEQADPKQAVDARTDVYALGVTLYEMLAGAPPFSAESAVAAITEILMGAHPPLAALRPDLPLALTLAVERAFAREPAQRFATMEGFSEVLAPFERDDAREVSPVSAAAGTRGDVDPYGPTAPVSTPRAAHRPTASRPRVHPALRAEHPTASRPPSTPPSAPASRAPSRRLLVRALVAIGILGALAAIVLAAVLHRAVRNAQRADVAEPTPGVVGEPAPEGPPRLRARRVASAARIRAFEATMVQEPERCLREARDYYPTAELLLIRVNCATQAGDDAELAAACAGYRRLVPQHLHPSCARYTP